jgi:hypothetical protein
LEIRCGAGNEELFRVLEGFPDLAHDDEVDACSGAVAETLGLGPLHPEIISPTAMVETLIADLPPERTEKAAALAAHQASAAWKLELRSSRRGSRRARLFETVDSLD